MGKKMTGHLRCDIVDVHSNAPALSQNKAATLFSLFQPSGFSRVATQSFLASFSLFSCMASFLSTTSIASLTCFWRPQQGSRIDIGERGDWPASVGEDRKNSVALETAEHHQPLLNDLLAVSLVTGKKKMWRKLSVGRTWKRAKRLLAQGSRWRRAQTRMSPTSLSEKTETWCSLIADSLAQNKPVVSIRHHNKELKRDPKTTRQTAATSEGKTELECSRWSFSPCASDCAATVTTTLATVICPVTNPDNENRSAWTCWRSIVWPH